MMIFLVWGCTSLNELELAKEYIEIPADVDEVSTHYVGEGQARFLYVRFQLPTALVDEFVRSLCLHDSELLSSYRFDQLYEKPAWFTPDWSRSKGGESGACIENGVFYTMVIEDNEDQAVIYILLAW